MEALHHRFIPVTIQPVQTSQFHERKQGPQESVDTFTQDLRQLFRKAYPSVSRESQEAEEMGKAVSTEAKGQPHNKVATLVPSLRTKELVEVQRQDEAVEGILNDTLLTLHDVQPAAADIQGAVLGLTSTTTVLVEGTPAEPLLDNKSPVTIVSLDFLAKGHCDHDTIRQEVKGCLEPTALKLKSYSGEALPIVKQAHVQLSQGSYSITICVQVQMNAPIQVPRVCMLDLEDLEQTQSCMPKVKKQDQEQVLQATNEQPAQDDHQPDPTTHPTATV